MTPRALRPELANTARARREALLAAVRLRRAGVTIYGLALQLGRPYRRVFESVKRLAAEGAVRVEPVLRNNRRATLVSAAPLSHARSPLELPAHLSELERAALRAVSVRLERLDPRIVSLYVFGSRARGDSTSSSDLDLAIRVSGRRDAALERTIIAAIADIEWSAPLEGALRVSPLVLFAKERRAALERAIDTEGVAIWKAHA